MKKTIQVMGSIAIAATCSGCWRIYDNPAAQYIERGDTITTSAGNAKDINAVTHTIDPWPRYVGNRRIPANGERMTRAVERYRTGPPLAQGSSVPQVIGIPVGSATPTGNPSPASTPPL